MVAAEYGDAMTEAEGLVVYPAIVGGEKRTQDIRPNWKLLIDMISGMTGG